MCENKCLFNRGPAEVIKCSPFLSFFSTLHCEGYIAGSLLLEVLAGSLKYFIRHFEKHEAWRTVNRKTIAFWVPSLYDAQVYERKFKSEYLEKQFYVQLLRVNLPSRNLSRIRATFQSYLH